MPQLIVPAPVIAQQAAGGTSVFMLVMIAALILLMFLSFRKSKKIQQEQAAMRGSLVPGEEVMTAAGIFGTVVAVDADGQRVTLEVAPGVAMDVHLQTVTTRVSDLPATGAADVAPTAERTAADVAPTVERTAAGAAPTAEPTSAAAGAHAAADPRTDRG